jgi:hypothetical protein
MTTSGDMLLYVLSSKRELSWPVFKRVFDTLAARELAKYDNAAVARNIVLRAFDSLGHCDVISDSDGLRIAIAPSSLVRLPTSVSIAVLCGSRSPETIDVVRTAAARFQVVVETLAHPGDLSPLLPQRVILRAQAGSSLSDFAKSLGITVAATPPAHELVCMSATLVQIAESLEWKTAPELQWSSADFDPEHNRFTRQQNGRLPFRLTRYLDPVKNIFRYYIWNSDQCAAIDPDWGRYLALQKSGFSVLYFDSTQHLLTMPKSLPLPRLLARAVTLCSGSSPRTLMRPSGREATAFAVYELVPNSIAQLVAAKMGQDLSYSTFAVQRSIA